MYSTRPFGALDLFAQDATSSALVTCFSWRNVEDYFFAGNGHHTMDDTLFLRARLFYDWRQNIVFLLCDWRKRIVSIA